MSLSNDPAYPRGSQPGEITLAESSATFKRGPLRTDDLTIHEHMEVDRYPNWLIALHRLASLGKAARYAGQSNRFCSFEVNDIMRNKWPELQEVERGEGYASAPAVRVMLIYRDPRMEAALGRR